MPDFVMLDSINEQSFMKNLELRFNARQIYTYIGEQVVSMNPFQRLNIYTPEEMRKYRNMELYEVQPHLFALGDDTYRNLLRTKQDQCVLITGESGAGKTEASKYFMQYIVHISGGKLDGGGQDIKERLLESNPVLEAFGNAKTLRNDNSSRFGKYMEIQFSGAGVPIGGKISQYLLEKSRVVTRAQDERSFHIFYQLLSESSLLGKLKLDKDPNKYRLLAMSNCSVVRGMNDSSEFAEVREAMKMLEFPKEDQEAVWRIIAAILHLGNVEFDEDSKDTSTINSKTKGPFDIVSGLLSMNADMLNKALTTNEIKSGVQVIHKNLNKEQAGFARDSFCKALYDKLFDWVVARINSSIECKQTPEIVIGVLDIYGFEIFEVNSFEQFCINYCNEKLQQLFIRLVLESEQEEYHREGIEWTDIDYFNNAPIVNLIEEKQGIFKMLDEACMIGQPTPEDVLRKLNNKFNGHDHYASWDKTNRDIPRDAFRIKHYAGVVDYHVTEFVFKNTDTLFRTIKNAIGSSKDTLVCNMFPKLKTESKKRPVSAGWQFKVNVCALVEKLNKCHPHYIRCIKSNDKRQGFKMNLERVKHQVAYLNLIETVRVRRAGFCNRQPYARFLHRYKMCSPQTWPRWHGALKDGVRVILDTIGVQPEEYRMGKTKLFVRNASTLTVMERFREKEMPKVAIVIQRTWRRLRVKGKVLRYINEILPQYRRGGNPNYSFDSPVPEPRQMKDCQGLQRKNLYNWWFVFRILAMAPNVQATLREKCRTYELLGGRKPYDFKKSFVGDYYESQVAANPKISAKVAKARADMGKHDPSPCVFSCEIMRVNLRCKSQKRGLFITQNTVFRTDAKSFRVKPARFPLSSVQSIHVSPQKDSWVIIKFAPPFHDYIMDVGLNGADRVAECVTVVQRWASRAKKTSVPVVVEEPIAYNPSRNAKKKGIECTLEFAKNPKPPKDGNNVFKKVGGGKTQVFY